jgi:hypothetical protein
VRPAFGCSNRQALGSSASMTARRERLGRPGGHPRHGRIKPRSRFPRASSLQVGGASLRGHTPGLHRREHHIARFWHLHESLIEIPRAAAPVSITTQIPTDRAFVIAGAAAEGSHSTAEVLLPGGEEGQTRFPLDPNVVIAAAFKAAGLPVPEIPTAPDAKPRVAPGPIIAAALKAAGLLRRSRRSPSR